MQSISTSALAGSPSTAKVARAGGFSGKYSAYMPLTSAKEAMSARRSLCPGRVIYRREARRGGVGR